MPLRAKEFRYAIELGADLRTEQGVVLDAPAGWSPEHLLLAALVRCTFESLRYHARRARIDVSGERASARALFTKRESDERYAVVDSEIDLAVRLSPLPAGEELDSLLAKAERDCFIGASLTVAPRYRWTLA